MSRNLRIRVRVPTWWVPQQQGQGSDLKNTYTDGDQARLDLAEAVVTSIVTVGGDHAVSSLCYQSLPKCQQKDDIKARMYHLSD